MANGRLNLSPTPIGTAPPPSGNLYGVPANPLCDDGAGKALRLMLRDVRLDVRSGTLVVTNRATGAVIFTGSVRNLAHGTFTAGNMPPGPGYAAGADSDAGLQPAARRPEVRLQLRGFGGLHGHQHRSHLDHRRRGVSPSTAITGFGPGIIVGTQHSR